MDNAGNAVVAYETIHHRRPRHASILLGSRGDPGEQLRLVRSDIITVGFRPDEHFRPSVALSPTGGSYVVAYDTDLLGVPGNKTVEVTEVNASNIRVFVANLPAFPNNFAPAVSIGGSGKYLLTFMRGSAAPTGTSTGGSANCPSPRRRRT